MRLLVYTGKTPLYNASVKGDIHLYMTVYMWGLRGRYFLTIIYYNICIYIYMYIYTLYMLEMCRFRMKDEETWCSKKKHFKTEKYMTSLCFQSV